MDEIYQAVYDGKPPPCMDFADDVFVVNSCARESA